MRIGILNKIEEDNVREISKLIRSTLKVAGAMHHIRDEFDVHVALVNDEIIRKYNKKYRLIDKATDVLSFPMFDFVEPADFDSIDKFILPGLEKCLLGDIIISWDKIYSQAFEYGHSNEREAAFLSLHGFLHLLGYDHIDDTDRILMEKVADNILEECGLSR